MVTRVKVNPKVLEWGLKIGDAEESRVQEKFPKIQDWMTEKSEPTFNQLNDLSKFLNIPIGYLLLDEPINIDTPLVEYRTLQSSQLDEPSIDLLAIIEDMEIKQTWMRDFYLENNYEQLPFVGIFKENRDIVSVTNYIRNIFEIPLKWQKELKKINRSLTAYNYFKQKIQDQRVLVFQDGIVNGNTRRNLDVQEFRGFTLIDDYAPLIFINSKDSNNGKLFTLLHELVHILIGNDSIMSGYASTGEFKGTEAFCNAVSAELLVPIEIFLKEWEENIHEGTDRYDLISDLSGYFMVSQLVIARRALEQGFIDQIIYQEVEERTKNNLDLKKKLGSSSKNIDYYTLQKSKLDPKLIIALHDSVNNGSAPFTDIYKNTAMKRDNFNHLVNKLLNHQRGELY